MLSFLDNDGPGAGVARGGLTIIKSYAILKKIYKYQ
jgi:hypothetical protein